MKCSDISSGLVDFLYEEMAPADRSAFSAHLAECPACAAAVKASSRALQRTRSALRGSLNEEVPARVHANILALARAAQPAPARKPRVEAKEGIFARLLKAPWLLPAMGAAGVATAVFLIKVIKNPEVLPVREPARPPAAVAKPLPAEDKAAAPAPDPAEPHPETKPLAAREEREAVSRKRDHAASRAAPARPAPAVPLMRARKHLMEDLLGDLDVGAAPATRSYAPEYRPSEAAAPAPAPASPTVVFAAPPVPSAAPSKPAPHEPLAKARKSGALEDPRDEAAESAPLRAGAAEKDVSHAEKKSNAAKETFDERVRKAEKLYNEKKWSEAATAYRALLAEAPKHPLATTWRQRMLVAEGEQETSRSLKAKKATSADPLDGI